MLKQHTIIVGLNDKDTKKQEFTTKQCLTRMVNILETYTNGYSIRLNKGGYRHNDNTFINEKSATIDLMYIKDKQVKFIINELKTQLNQESILYTKTKLKGRYV